MTNLSVTADQAVHATSIVIGETGLLFLGVSGAGKSGAAFACLAEAAVLGWNAALIADDRTLLSVHADCCIASCPDPIKGLLELRGTGLLRFRRFERAVMHCAVEMTKPSPDTRYPPESETFSCNGASMPLMRLWHDGAATPLACLRAARPELFLG